MLLKHKSPQSEGTPAAKGGALDSYVAAVAAFEGSIRQLEHEGRKGSAEWQLASGLFRLAQALRQDQQDRDEQRKSFARSWRRQR